MFNKNNRFAAGPAVPACSAAVGFALLLWAYETNIILRDTVCLYNVCAELRIYVIRKADAELVGVDLVNVANHSA